MLNRTTSPFAAEPTNATKSTSATSSSTPSNNTKLSTTSASTGCRNLLSSNTNVVNAMLIPGVNIRLPVQRNASRPILTINTKRLCNADLPINNANSRAIIAKRHNLIGSLVFAQLSRLRSNSFVCVGIVSRALKCRISQVDIVRPSSISQLGVIPNRSQLALVAYAPCNVGARQLLISKRHITVPLPTPSPTSIHSRHTARLNTLTVAVIYAVNNVLLYYVIIQSVQPQRQVVQRTSA